MKPSRKQLTEWARQAAQAEYARHGVQCHNSPRGHSLEWQDGGYCDYCGDPPEVNDNSTTK